MISIPCDNTEAANIRRTGSLAPRYAIARYQGREVFRFETFGDEAWWTDTIQLHRAIEGQNHGGVGEGEGEGVSSNARLSNLAGLWSHQKGGFYHDGPFATLDDLVNHHDACLGLNLTNTEKRHLVQFLSDLIGSSSQRH